MFVWQSTYDTRVNDLKRQLKDKETFRLKAIQEYEQQKIVAKLYLKQIADLTGQRDALKSELEEQKVTASDCRSVDGLTVGLIDAFIALSRVLARRDMGQLEVQEALADLRSDEDVAAVMTAAAVAKRVVC